MSAMTWSEIKIYVLIAMFTAAGIMAGLGNGSYRWAAYAVAIAVLLDTAITSEVSTPRVKLTAIGLIIAAALSLVAFYVTELRLWHWIALLFLLFAGVVLAWGYRAHRSARDRRGRAYH